MKWTVLALVVLVAAAGTESKRKNRPKQGPAELKPDFQFIDKVHELAYDLSKEVVVTDSQVAWSPFSVANILPLISGDDSMKQSFNQSIEHLRVIKGLRASRVSVAFTNKTVNGADYNTVVVPIPDDTKVLEEQVRYMYQNETGSPAPLGLVPEGSLDGAKEVYLTSFKIALGWRDPFTYRFAKTERFFLNATHAVRARYLFGKGVYRFAELEDLNCSMIALPLKDAPTMYFLVFVPDNFDDLDRVSDAIGKRNITELFGRTAPENLMIRIPKTEINNQLIFTHGDAKIVHSGSVHLTYPGIENDFGGIPPVREEGYVSKRKGFTKFSADRPFVFMVYEAFRGGILSYGEVMAPSEYAVKEEIKYHENALSPSSRIMSEAVDKFGDDLYSVLKKRQNGSFVISPLGLTNLLGSLIMGGNEDTKMGILKKLNFPLLWQESLVEMNEKGAFNESVSSSTVKVNGEPKEAYVKSVEKFATKVEGKKARDFPAEYDVKSILAASTYEVTPRISPLQPKIVQRPFHLNERDSVEVDYIETYVPGLKYMRVPLWDAWIWSIPVNDLQNQSLVFVIPGLRSGLNLIEDGVANFPIAKLLCQGAVRQKIRPGRVRIPKMVIENVVDFGDSLRDLGMESFVDGDFSDVVANGKLDKILQKVVLKVDMPEKYLNSTVEPAEVLEEGYKNSTSAVAPPSSTTVATEVTSATKAPSSRAAKQLVRKRRKQRISVEVNSPFMFYLQDARVGTVLVGRYVGPEGARPDSSEEER